MSQAVLRDEVLIEVTPERPMLSVCPVPGCSTLTMGGTCVAHDAPVMTTFPRGRPHVAVLEPGLAPVAIRG